jgi:predicted dehydrogenase
METRIGIAIVGYGNWGPRIARSFADHDAAEVRWVCDPRAETLAQAARRHPGARTAADARAALEDPAVHGVYIATPVGTHEALVLQALDAGKDVLVEKPLAGSSEAARRCVERAEALGRVLMVGHTFVYSPPVRKLRDLVASGELGRLYYVDSSRVNLGLFQKDVSVVWDLAPHDLSIVLFATGRRAVAVASHGKSFVGANNLEDVATITVELDDGALAYVHLSWLAPVKLRRTTLVGDRRMVVYDDLEPVEKVKIFDRRVERMEVGPSFGEFQLAYRFGDVVSPVLSSQEPLAMEAQAFLDAVRTRRAPESDGRFGLQIVEILEAATRSMREQGRFVKLSP